MDNYELSKTLRKRLFMKKVKQILAILGIVLILGVNILLVFAAGTASEDNMGTFHAAIVTVVLVPVLLWVYLFFFKLMKKRREDAELEEDVRK